MLDRRPRTVTPSRPPGLRLRTAQVLGLSLGAAPWLFALLGACEGSGEGSPAGVGAWGGTAAAGGAGGTAGQGGTGLGGEGAGIPDAAADVPLLDGATDDTWTRLDAIRYDFPADYTGSFDLRYWCNLVWDPLGQRMLFYEGYLGSHGQQGGTIYANTLYGLTVGDSTVHLVRSTPSWSNPAYDTFELVDGPPEPHPRHTYGAFAYVPHRHSVYLGFGACAHATTCPGGSPATDFWRYDVGADQWLLIDASLPDESIGGYGGVFAALPGSDDLWHFSPRRDSSGWINIYRFDMQEERWSPKVSYGEDVSILVHAVADADREVFWVWTAHGGAGQLRRFDPVAEQLTMVASTPATLPTTGAMAYLTPHHSVLLYSAESDVFWRYDPDADQWTERSSPSDPNERIDHYFAYDPLDDVVVAFNVANEFWFYRYAP